MVREAFPGADHSLVLINSGRTFGLASPGFGHSIVKLSNFMKTSLNGFACFRDRDSYCLCGL